MKNKIKYYFILLVSTLSGHAQCPESVRYWEKLQDIYNLSVEKQTFAYLELKKTGISCNLNNDSTYANVLFGLSGIYYYNGNMKLAIHYAEQAISLVLNGGKQHKPENLSKFYYYSGVYYFAQNDYQNALIAFQNCKSYCRKYRNYPDFFIISCQNMAVINYNLGDYEKSIKQADDGINNISILKYYQFNYLFRLYYEKSKSYLELKNYTLATTAVDGALTAVGKYQNNQLDLGYGYFLKGNILSFDTKKYVETEKVFFKAVNIFEKLRDLPNLGIAYTNLGNFYNQFKKYDKGIKYSNLAFVLIKDNSSKARILNNIGFGYQKKNDFRSAFKYYQKALGYFSFKIDTLAITTNPNINQIRYVDFKEFLFSLFQDKALCWLDYSKSENNKKEYLKYALQTYEVADKLIDYMRYEHTGTQSKYFWRKQTRSVYENAIETCYLLKDYEKAFYFFEKSRAVMLNDKLNELGAKQTLSETDRQEERTFIKNINELNANIESAKNQAEKDKINAKLIDLQEKQEKFIKSLETKNPAYYQLKYDNTTTTLKQFQTYLTPSGGRGLEYFMGDSATYAIVVSPNSVSLKKLNYNATNSKRFLEFCSKDINTKAELSQFLTVSSDVYKSLIQPLNLPKGRLIISPDGVFLPFEALSKSATKAEYLLNDFAISYTYSVQSLLKNTQKATFMPQNKFLGIAPVNFTQKLSSLNGSVESLDKIAKNYFWSTKFVEQQGNKKAFLDNAKNHQIVQIYTHAFADSNETEPRIHFADSTLKVSELSIEQQFKTNLLVLSACKTAVGKVAAGEGVLSLARGFSMAGIPSTITSLWSIGDTDTYTLTELFYQNLNEGLPKDEALQRAKIAFIASKTNAMPNAWAGMVLIGDSSAIGSDYWYVWLLLGIALAGIVGFWYWRKKRNAIVFLNSATPSPIIPK